MSELPKTNDEMLVLRLRKNDMAAFDTLFKKYNKQLFNFSWSLLKSGEDSEEIVQEVFCRIWEKRNDIDSSKSFKSFLFKISYNLIIDQLRLKLQDQHYRKYIEDYFQTNAFRIEDKTDYNTIKKEIDSAVDELPGKRKQIFQLSRVTGLSNKEIAEKLDISPKTVENQITLALKHIKTKLGKDILPLLLFFALFQ
jgi:RNA polymerase sigma-70 factor (family 1)